VLVPGPAPAGTPVVGLDFGVRNPFAAVWGVLDRDDILWLTGEHYCRNQTLDFHQQHMPREVIWYCDPAGARERIELTAAGRKVRPGINDLRLGIMAVRSRLETGRLRVVDGACPNLLYEAGLYRYDDATNGRGSETPLSESNHALDALRYLITRLDQRRMAKDRRPAAPADGAPPPSDEPPPKEHWSKRWGDEELWTRLT